MDCLDFSILNDVVFLDESLIYKDSSDCYFNLRSWDGKIKTIHVTLKYDADKNEKVITGIKRISKPGLRVYAGKDEIPSVLGGLGIAILSTNQGIVTDKEARKLQVGGEVLAFVW